MFLLKKEPVQAEIQAFYNATNLFITSPNIFSKRNYGSEVLKCGKLRRFDEEKVLQSGVLDDSSWIWENFEADVGDLKQVCDTYFEEGTVIVIVFKTLSKVVKRNEVLSVGFIGLWSFYQEILHEI